jgi:hypothetical protein
MVPRHLSPRPRRADSPSCACNGCPATSTGAKVRRA